MGLGSREGKDREMEEIFQDVPGINLRETCRFGIRKHLLRLTLVKFYGNLIVWE